MSSFKRKSSSSQSKRILGVRPSASSAAVLNTSTGIPSFDDILGGGLQLSTSLLVLSPDPHSAHGDLLQKYFIAQGLASGQDVCVICENADNLVENCMWTQKPSEDAAKNQSSSVDIDEELSPINGAIKIAWRYESMQKFQTTVDSPTSPAQEEYCCSLDLTCRIPLDVVKASKASRQLLCVDVASLNCDESYDYLLEIIEEALRRASDWYVLRLSIPSFASPFWGDPTPEKILCFLHSLRSALRTSPNACALLTLPSHLCSEWGGPGWVQKLGWLSDSCINLDSFTGKLLYSDPFMSALFPSYHGLLRIHRLSSLYTLVPPSDRFSTLRGLSSASSSSSSGGVGENNLAFKVTRKRFLFETLHLDLEGGVNERRTTPLPSASAPANDDNQHRTSVPAAHLDNTPVISIGFEDHWKGSPALGIVVADNLRNEEKPPKAKKPKKRVGFLADRPELYDF
ncbi:PAXNEB-domain-containing protein [Rickenella mellea]|uniref:Elongator complex protein 4 n=1 Tax=Rickenella mellea TaxID=50990 RepID=A0A4Y7QL34_9AGAM|nr:PAXNEB-domain-containing protein [Rickenella mellea]